MPRWEHTLNCRRSHTLRDPSSPPLSRKGSRRLQLMTLTSPSWAAAVVSMQALLGAARMSQMRMEASAEQELKTWKRSLSDWGSLHPTRDQVLVVGPSLGLAPAPPPLRSRNPAQPVWLSWLTTDPGTKRSLV